MNPKDNSSSSYCFSDRKFVFQIINKVDHVSEVKMGVKLEVMCFAQDVCGLKNTRI